jgi:hypothetical protein
MAGVVEPVDGKVKTVSKGAASSATCEAGRRRAGCACKGGSGCPAGPVTGRGPSESCTSSILKCMHWGQFYGLF